MLVARGLITRDQLKDALLAQQQFGGRLGTVLVEMGSVGEDQLAAALSEQLHVPWVRPDALATVPPDVIARLPRDLAEKYRVVPLRVDRELHIGSADPQNFERLDELRFRLGCPVRAYVVSERSLSDALERYYGVRRDVRPQYAVGAFTGHDGFGASSPPSALSPSPDAPTVGLTGVIDQLASVMTDDDVVGALARYFSETFAHAVVLAMGDGVAAPVVHAHRGRSTRQSGPMLTVSAGTVLHDLLLRPQIVHRAQVTDPELRRMCGATGVPASQLTVVPVFDDGGRLPYVVVAQGRDEAYLRGAFPAITAFLAKVAHALRIVALRADIRVA